MFRTAIRSALSNRQTNRPRSRWSRTRLWLQGLEDRSVPALLTVTSSLDDGVGDTLRNVMAVADSNGQDDTIQFAGGVTNITLALGELTLINEGFNTTFNGTGVTIDGASASRIFNFNVVGGNPTITIDGLTLANGNATAGGGGAILMNNDPLVVINTTFQNNKATGIGGAIATTASVPTSLDVSGSTFTGNTATTTGGAISGASTLTLNVANSTFTSNKSTSTGGAIQMSTGGTATIGTSTFGSNTASANGGALSTAGTTTMTINSSTFTGNQGTNGGMIRFNSSSPSILNINDSTMSGNIASGRGGAVYSVATAAINISGSTINGNMATGNGGGVAATTSTTTITNSTISGNTSNGTSGGGGFYTTTGVVNIRNTTIAFNNAGNAAGLGGGIRKTSATGTLTLNSTIVGQNTATGAGGDDIHATAAIVIAGGDNLVQDTVGNFTLSGSNVTGQDPLLNALGSNGGPTMTHTLQSGSPASNAGNNLAGLMYDQRGMGFDRVLGGIADIGSVEGVSLIPSAKATSPNVPPINASQIVTVVYSDETGINTGGIGLGNIRLTGPGYGAPEAPSAFMITSGMNGDPMVTVEYTFIPPGGTWEYTENGKYTVEMQAGQVFDTDMTPNAVPAGPKGTFSVNVPLPPLVVDNINDIDDGIYTANELTLREAIKLTNEAIGTQDTITFAPALNGMTITLASTLTITDPVIITGPGATNLTVSGGGLVRIFEVNVPGTGSTVSFSGLTLEFGSAATGAAIQAADEAIIVSGCTVRSNVGTSTGGAITISATAGSLTVDESFFDLNSSTAGGAITTQVGAGLLVRGSLFTNNSSTAGNAGGAISIWGTISAFGSKIQNSTFMNNSSPFTGGAIGFRASFAGQTFIQNCTIVGNTAAGTGIGAGIGVIAGQTGTVVIESSIVYGNTKTGGIASDIGGPTQMTANFSMIGSAADSAVFVPDATTTALLGVDPLLSGLASNGGPTQTMIPQGGSLAFNNGSNPAGLMFDQRGMGFPRELQTVPDIGAVESVNVIPSALATSPNVPPANATQIVTLVYTDETGINTGGIGLGNIRLTGPGYGAPEAPTAFNITSGMNGDKMVTVEYTFTPPGGTWEETDNGIYSIEMQASQVFDTDMTPNAVTAGPKGSFAVAFAKTFLVDNIGDIDDGLYGPNELTLREAIKLANENIGLTDNITFAPSIDGQTILIANGELAASDPFNLIGNGVAKTIISGNFTNRIFNLGHTGKTSTLDNATFRDCLITGLSGGAIVMNSSNLTINNCLFTNNTCGTAQLGGAINLGAATLTINDSVFQGNTGGSNGGGAIGTGTGTITINRSTFTQNVVTGTGSAILVNGAGTLNVTDSTIYDNSSSGASGGAITTTTGTITIINSTVSGNVSSNAASAGGGIRLTSTGKLFMFNSTVTNNTAGAGGGGIASTVATSTIEITSSIVAQNNNATHPDLFTTTATASTVTLNNSILGASTDPDITVINNASQVGSLMSPINALLAPLGNYGGPTQTHGLAFGSPAIDKGSNTKGLMFDQRGPGFPRETLPADPVDIGSFEGVLTVPAAAATLPDVPPANATYVATVVYTDNTGINTTKLDAGDVRLTGPGYAMPEAPSKVTVMGMNGDKSVTVEYEFTPPGGSWDQTDNGTYTLSLQSNEVFDIDGNPAFAGSLGTFSVSFAANYLVNQIGDVDDMDPNNGMMTLREALRLSNTSVGVTDTISFDASINGMSIDLTASLAPTDSVIINGNGATNTIISGSNLVRIINLTTLAGLAITINGVTLTNGNVSGNGATVDMGGDSTLTINDCVISNGTSTATAGGIRSGATTGGSLTIRRTTFMNNTTTNAGAAIYCRSNLLVEDCLFVNNMTTGASIGGGAICITNSGGVRSNIIRNSTFNGNTSNRGGAFSLESSQGTIIIQNCTIAGNTATAADGGGGIAVGSGTANYLVESSIISGNFATASANTDMFSPNTVTANNSLIGVATGVVTFTPDATTTLLLGQDPMLSPLASNGGPTQTMAIDKMSPAWNKGSNPASLTGDQRGALYARSSFGAADIGAFEVQAPPQVANVIVDDGTGQRSLVRSITVQFDNSFVLTPGAFTLTRYANGTAGTIGLVATPMGNDVVLTFNNTGTIALDPGASLPDGTYELIIVADNVTGTAGKLDGNKNFISEGSPVDNVSSKLHRLFGDANGDGSVTASDFNAFRLDYGITGSSIFDFDDSGSVNAADFNFFRLRYGQTGYQP